MSLFSTQGIITDDGRHDSKRWNLLEGIASGQTQVDIAKDGYMSVWSFPLDLHYSTTTIHGWPKFTCEVCSPRLEAEKKRAPACEGQRDRDVHTQRHRQGQRQKLGQQWAQERKLRETERGSHVETQTHSQPQPQTWRLPERHPTRLRFPAVLLHGRESRGLIWTCHSGS
eukprot:3328870-Rhodomonas_salina.1